MPELLEDELLNKIQNFKQIKGLYYGEDEKERLAKLKEECIDFWRSPFGIEAIRKAKAINFRHPNSIPVGDNERTP